MMGWSGDLAGVTVGGVAYPTVIDEYGTQRFIADPILRALFNSGVLNLSVLAVEYQNGRSGLTQRQYAELNMKLGYSICGFADLSSFHDMEINNPLWEK